MEREKLEMEVRIAKEKLLFQEKENERLLQVKEKERQYNERMKDLDMQDMVKQNRWT